MGNFYKNFIEKCRQSSFNLQQNKININESDSYADKTFFAFLADLLKIKKDGDFRSKLINELRENETLTKERLQILLKDSLKEYLKLDKEILEQKGLAKLDYEKINKLLDDKNFMDFTHELINDKFNKLKKFANSLKEQGKDSKTINDALKKQDLGIKAKDIQSMSAKASSAIKDKDTQKIVGEAIKIARAVILKK